VISSLEFIQMGEADFFDFGIRHGVDDVVCQGVCMVDGCQ
jgi:hypothetical protein